MPAIQTDPQPLPGVYTFSNAGPNEPCLADYPYPLGSRCNPGGATTAGPGPIYTTQATPECSYCMGDPVCLAGCESAPVPYVPDSGIPVFTATGTATNGCGWLCLLLLAAVAYAATRSK